MEGRLELNADEFTTLDLDPPERLGIEQPLDVPIGVDVPPVGVADAVECGLEELLVGAVGL